MAKRYEVVNGFVAEVWEERTALSPDATAELLNNKQAHIEGLLARIAELESAQPAPAVTPEWLAETWHETLRVVSRSSINPWGCINKDVAAENIEVAKRVLEQMPAQAPVVVDVVKLDYDWKASGIPSDQDAFRYALEAQGISCK